jgi:hypothetical protein
MGKDLYILHVRTGALSSTRCVWKRIFTFFGDNQNSTWMGRTCSSSQRCGEKSSPRLSILLQDSVRNAEDYHGLTLNIAGWHCGNETLDSF